MNEIVIKVSNITKKYHNLTAVNDISFEITKGQVFGIVGPNGSGKTTTLSMILGLKKASSGMIVVLGQHDLEKSRKSIGTVLEATEYYPEFSAIKNLKISAMIKNIGFAKIEMVLEQVELKGRMYDKYCTYSYGMKQRLAIASALLGEPKIIILDEPTNGLDPGGIVEIRELIRNLAQQGKTIIVASHLLNEMEKICTDIVILNKGKIVCMGKLQAIISKHQTLENAFMHLTN